MKFYALLLSSAFAATPLFAQNPLPATGWAAKQEIMATLGDLAKNKTSYTQFAVSPLLFLWFVNGKAADIASLDDLIDLIVRMHPDWNADYLKHLFIDDLADDFGARLADGESFENVLDDLARRFHLEPGAYHRGLERAVTTAGARTCEATLHLHSDAFTHASPGIGAEARATYRLTYESGNLTVELIEGGALRVDPETVLRAENVPFRVQRADPAFDFFDRLLRANIHPRINSTSALPAYRKSRFASGLLQYLFEKEIGREVFAALTDDELLRLLARDKMTYAVMKSLYESGTDRGLRNMLRLARVRNFFNLRLGLITGVVGGAAWLLWDWLKPESLTEKQIGQSIGAVYGNQEPDWDLKGYLVQLIETGADIDTLKQTVRAMDDKVAQVLWHYLFVAKSEG